MKVLAASLLALLCVVAAPTPSAATGPQQPYPWVRVGYLAFPPSIPANGVTGLSAVFWSYGPDEVPHGGPPRFLVAHVLAQACGPGPGIEVGWADFSWEPGPVIYVIDPNRTLYLPADLSYIPPDRDNAWWGPAQFQLVEERGTDVWDAFARVQKYGQPVQTLLLDSVAIPNICWGELNVEWYSTGSEIPSAPLMVSMPRWRDISGWWSGAWITHEADPTASDPCHPATWLLDEVSTTYAC